MLRLLGRSSPLNLSPRICRMPLVTITSNIAEQLKKHGIFNDVIDPFDQKGLISASYKANEVTMGNTLKPSETQDRPEVHLTFNEPDSSAKYTLVVTDPDAPKRGDPKWSEFAHFITSGISPEAAEGESYKVDFSKAKELLPYMGPAPPEKTGKHRYVFLLFKENGAVKGLPSDNRANWGTGVPGSGVRDWAKKQNLTPVAINFFFAQNDKQD